MSESSALAMALDENSGEAEEMGVAVRISSFPEANTPDTFCSFSGEMLLKTKSFAVPDAWPDNESVGPQGHIAGAGRDAGDAIHRCDAERGRVGEVEGAERARESGQRVVYDVVLGQRFAAPALQSIRVPAARMILP